MPRFFLPFVFLATLVAARAQTIAWFSDPQRTNLTSAGAAMDGGFQFELGVFSGNFVPTAANRGEWLGHWSAAARTAYSTATRRFDAQFTVTGNAAPFTSGKRAYIWGFSGAEWILLTAPDWTWPTYVPGNIDPFGDEWSAADATAIVGSVNAAGFPFLMQSAAVPDAALPVTTFAQWQAIHSPGPATADPDHDGSPNLLEFVFGTPPNTANPSVTTTASIVTIGNGKFLQINIPRRQDHLADLSVEVSEDLLHWRSGPAETSVIQNDTQALVVRSLIPLDAIHPRQFLRLRAQLP